MRNKRGFMTISDYEHEFIDKLIETYEGGSWKAHVRKCYEIYMDSKDEKRIEKWEIERL